MRHHPAHTVFRFGLLVFGIGILAGSVFLFSVVRDLPDPSSLAQKPISQSTKIYDRTGETLLYEIHGEEKRTVIPFSEMTPLVKNTILAAEDSSFYSHGGIDLKGIVRALYIDVRSKGIAQGGSTITQQLIRNTLIGNEQTITRKLKEAVLAILLESKYSKDDILAMYLNQIPFGSNAYGIEAAAQTFFGKNAKNLSLAEAATLASLPKGPTYYSPYGTNKDKLLARKDAVIDQMQKLGMISAEERDAAKKEVLVFQPPKTNIKAPHFVMFVKDYLENHYDPNTIENGGLRVTTTLDWDLQQKAEQIISDSVDRNKSLGANNASLVAINPKTGQILSMVGSRDYFDVSTDGNVNVSIRPRQPGSAFKPLAYATAFEKGYTPETALFDAPTEFNPSCGPDFLPAYPNVKESDCYHPQNYDGKFRGPVTMRQALQQSLNVPSVETLYLAGVEDTIKTAESLGISTLKDRSRFGLSLVLGGGEVTLLELTTAYGAFANDGVLNPTTPILKIEDSNGNTLEEYKQNPISTLPPEPVRELNSVLTDNEARVPVFIRNSSLYFPDREVAAKTGTTQDNRDAWTIGYTPSIVAGVWVGNNDNTPMKENTAGVLAAAPLWHKFLQEALATSSSEYFTPPEKKEVTKAVLDGFWLGGTVVKIDKISKKEATLLTPKEFIEDTSVGGSPHSILYWINKNDPEGPSPSDPSQDPQFKNWEAAIQKWLSGSGYKIPATTQVRSGSDDIHTEKNKPVLWIISPADTSLDKNAGSITLGVSSSFPLQEITARFDESPLQVVTQNSGTISLLLPSTLENGFHTLSVFVSDVYGNQQTLEKQLIVH